MKTNIISLFIIVVLFVGCSKPDNKQQLADLKKQKADLELQIKALETELGVKNEEKPDERIINVSVSPVSSQNFEHFVEVQGFVESENIVLVSPQMAGTLTGIYVSEGTMVKKGQLLASVDNQILRETLAEIKNQYELAVTVFEKQKALWEQQVGTEIQFLQAKNNKEALEKRMATMETQMSMSKVYAPISGTIEIVRQKQGEMAMPGAPIMQIVNLASLKATGKVPDIYLASVRKGQNVTIVFPDLKKEINSKISNVGALVDPISRAFGVEAKIPNVGNMLKPNQIAILKINDLAKANSIVIDQNLIQKTELGDIVYVATQNGSLKKAEGRKVTTGISYNGKIEVLTGLKEGDFLVTKGYGELVDGNVIAY